MEDSQGWGQSHDYVNNWGFNFSMVAFRGQLINYFRRIIWNIVATINLSHIFDRWPWLSLRLDISGG